MGTALGIIVAANLCMAASLRAFLTLYLLCSAMSTTYSLEFPQYLGFLQDPIMQIIVFVLAILEIATDKFRFFAKYFITAFAALRPAVAFLCAFTLLHFESIYYNFFIAFGLSFFLAYPILSLKGKQISAPQDEKIKFSNIPLSLAEDFAVLLVVIFAFKSPVITLAAGLAGIAFILFQRKEEPLNKGTNAEKAKKQTQQSGYGERDIPKSPLDSQAQFTQKKNSRRL